MWKTIKNYEEYYLVSDLGEIKSLRTGKVLGGTYDKDGYLIITLTNGNKGTQYKIHRLVCKAFKSNPNNKPVVNHKNGIKHDNKISNLEWVTHSENTIHAFETGLNVKGENHPNVKLNDKQVIEIRSKYIPYKYTCEMLGNEYGVSYGTIHKIIKNKRRGQIK